MDDRISFFIICLIVLIFIVRYRTHSEYHTCRCPRCWHVWCGPRWEKTCYCWQSNKYKRMKQCWICDSVDKKENLSHLGIYDNNKYGKWFNIKKTFIKFIQKIVG